MDKTAIANIIQKATHDLGQLYSINEDYSIPKSTRDSEVQKLVGSISQSIGRLVEHEEKSLSMQDRAFCHYLLGKALNSFPEYDQQAEYYLSKAIKLDNRLVDAWNSLGEVFWKKGDKQNAKLCFESPLTQLKKTNKESLRKLSMLLRQLGDSSAEKNENVKESLQKAKEAVALDIKDGMSWYILGNAHLTNYFMNSYDMNDLQKSLKAYTQSQQCSNIMKHYPDLYFNRATIYRYLEKYSESITDFEECYKLDSTFTEALQSVQQIKHFITHTTSFINKREYLKLKKIESAVDKLPGTHPALSFGSNPNKVVTGIVVSTLNSKSFIPASVILLCKDSKCVVVTLYNFAQNTVNVRDVLTISSPHLEEIKGPINNQEIGYTCIHVFYPNIFINNQPPSRNHFVNTNISLDDPNK